MNIIFPCYVTIVSIIVAVIVNSHNCDYKFKHDSYGLWFVKWVSLSAWHEKFA